MRAFRWSAALLALALSAPAPAESPIERGRYLVKITHCNDCHTAGFGPTAGQIPEADWLKGDPKGWVGPWGTTYAGNLRLFFSQISADDWLRIAREVPMRPPMPWFNLRDMHEADLRAMYAYIRHLGPAGEVMPAALPPGQRPTAPPYVEFHLPAPP